MSDERSNLRFHNEKARTFYLFHLFTINTILSTSKNSIKTLVIYTSSFAFRKAILLMIFRPGYVLSRIYFIVSLAFFQFLVEYVAINNFFFFFHVLLRRESFFACDFSDRFLLFIVQYENLYIYSFL